MGGFVSRNDTYTKVGSKHLDPIRMIRLFLIFVFLTFLSEIGFTQCKYVWKVNNKDTITKDSYFFPNISKGFNIHFDSIIGKISLPRFPNELTIRLNQQLDSLRQLKQDRIIALEILSIENDIKSVFQSIIDDSIEYVLYRIDTFKINNSEQLAYIFSTCFSSNWNEDFDKWFLYYSPEFGLIKYEYEAISGNFLDMNSFELIDNCLIGKNRQYLFQKLLNKFHNLKY